jgi:hypothetical protein
VSLVSCYIKNLCSDGNKSASLDERREEYKGSEEKNIPSYVTYSSSAAIQNS